MFVVVIGEFYGQVVVVYHVHKLFQCLNAMWPDHKYVIYKSKPLSWVSLLSWIEGWIPGNA